MLIEESYEPSSDESDLMTRKSRFGLSASDVQDRDRGSLSPKNFKTTVFASTPLRNSAAYGFHSILRYLILHVIYVIS
jgi:hypothetical protein